MLVAFRKGNGMKHKNTALFLAAALLLTACSETGASSSPSEGSSSDGISSESTSSSSTLPVSLEAKILSSLAPEDGLALKGVLKSSMTPVGGGTAMEIPDANIVGFVSDDEWYNDEEGDTYPAYHFFKGSEGNLVEHYIDEKNTVQEEPLEGQDEAGNSYDLPWDRDNPFYQLETSDLEANGEGQYLISLEDDVTLGTAFGLVLAGYDSMTATSIDVYAEGEAATRIVLTFAPFTYMETYEMNVSVDYQIVTRQEAGIPSVEPYPTEPEHAALKEAFAKLKKGNYSLTYTEIDVDGKYNDLTYGLEVSLKDDWLFRKDHNRDGSEAQYGYMKSGDGIVPFQVNLGQAVALSRPSDIDLASFFLNYSLAAEYYVPEGNGTYHLRAEGEDFVSLNSPAWPVEEELDYLISGTYYFTINDDGTYDIAYRYTWPSIIECQVSIHVYDIGTTTPRYTEGKLIDYVPPKSYEEYDIDLASFLYPYLGGDFSLLPYIYDKREEVIEMSFATIEGQLMLYFDIIDAEDPSVTLAYFEQELIKLGYVAGENGTYSLHIAGFGTIALSAKVEADDFYNRFVLAFDKFLPESPLYDYLMSVASAPNGTATSHVRMDYVSKDAATGEELDGYYIVSDISQEWEDGVYHSILTDDSDREGVSGTAETLALDDASYRSHTFAKEGDAWTYEGVGDFSTNVAHMNPSDLGYYLWTLVPYLQEGTYTLLSIEAINTLFAIMFPGYDLDATLLQTPIELVYDEASQTMSFEATIVETATFEGLGTVETASYQLEGSLTLLGETSIEEKSQVSIPAE